jgi:lipopolysaccharide cholinephosphotransferase
VKVDIFPIDGTMDNYACSIMRHKFMRLLSNVMSRKRRVMSIVWKTDKWNFCTCLFVRTLFYFISYRTLQKLVRRIVAKYPFETSNYAYDVVNPAYKRPVHCRRETYEQYIDVPFEGRTYKSIANYDAYLKKHYGDYMKLPPKEQQISNHDYRVWWKKRGR